MTKGFLSTEYGLWTQQSPKGNGLGMEGATLRKPVQVLDTKSAIVWDRVACIGLVPAAERAYNQSQQVILSYYMKVFQNLPPMSRVF